VAAIALVLVGLGIRLATYRSYMEAHVHRYGGIPPRDWLRRPVDDPAVEALRRRMAAGSLLAILGLVLLIVDLLV
jgi:hypothetical protein